MSNRIDTVPLRVIFMVPFVILILVTGTLIGYLTFQNSQRAVNALAGQLHIAVTDRIQERLDGKTVEWLEKVTDEEYGQ